VQKSKTETTCYICKNPGQKANTCRFKNVETQRTYTPKVNAVEQKAQDDEQLKKENVETTDDDEEQDYNASAEDDYTTDDDLSSQPSIALVKRQFSHSRMKKKVEVTIGAKKMQLIALIDPGSDLTIIKSTIVKSEIKNDSIEAKTLNNKDSINLKKISSPVKISYENYNVTLDFYSFDNMNEDIILGVNWCRLCGGNFNWKKDSIEFEKAVSTLTQDIVLEEEKKTDSLKKFLDNHTNKINFDKVFKRQITLPNHRKWDCVVNLKGGVSFKTRKNRNFMIEEKRVLKKYIDTMLAKKFIQQSTFKTASPLLIIPKKNGEKRICIDYRALNTVTEKEGETFPVVDDMIWGLNGKKIFTTIDLSSAYNHLRMAKTSEKFTTFLHPLEIIRTG
jgi:hypothetical protein